MEEVLTYSDRSEASAPYGANGRSAHFATCDPAQPAARAHGTPMSRPAQRQRRARILAAARKLIANEGVEGVTIRDIAEISNLSVQTIYNLAGGRAQVVEAAISEHIFIMAERARLLDTYPNIFLAVADLMWMHARQNPRYIRNATIACDGRDPALHSKVWRCNARSLRRLLNDIHGETARLKGIDLDVLASHITALMGAIALEWARGLIELPELRYRMASAYALLLAGLLTDDELAAINRWLADIRPPAHY